MAEENLSTLPDLLDPVFEQLNGIDDTGKLTEALHAAGFEYASSGSEASGAVLSEVWTHPTLGGFVFSYEYGSKTVARSEDYGQEDETATAIEQTPQAITDSLTHSPRYQELLTQWQTAGEPDHWHSLHFLGEGNYDSLLINVTDAAAIGLPLQDEGGGQWYYFSDLAQRVEAIASPELPDGTAYGLLPIAYEAVTGISELPETSAQKVGGVLDRLGLNLDEVELAYPKLSPEEHLADIQQEKEQVQVDRLMQQIKSEGKVSFEDEAGNVTVATLETMPGRSTPDLLVAVGQDSVIERMVAVRDPEANPQKVRQAFEQMGLLENDLNLASVDEEKEEAIRSAAQTRAMRANKPKSQVKESAGVEL